MIRLFKHYVPVPFLVLAVVETLLLVVAIVLAMSIRYWDWTLSVDDLLDQLPGAFLFAGVVTFAMFALGLYQREYARDLRTVFVRLVASLVLAVPVLALLFYVAPGLTIWRSALVIALVLALVSLLAVRAAFLRLGTMSALRRRVLVLGAAERAQRIAALERDRGDHGFSIVGFVPAGDAEIEVDPARTVSGVNRLSTFARERAVDEIVVAVEDRRRALPVEALLDCKLEGIPVVDFASFWEREAGRIDLDSLRPSWLIFSDGFGGGRLRRSLKRAFDIAAASALLVAGLPLFIGAAIAVRLESRGPVLYRQERVGLHGRPFMLLKFRSMRTDAESDGVARWASENDPRITRVGAFLRKTRIDELPQVFNVLRGDMSFVGPRPERPQFVTRLADQVPYYAERHRVKPGITGWAQLNYPYGASVRDAKAKLEFDLYYVKNYSVFLDFVILIQTARVVLWPDGVR